MLSNERLSWREKAFVGLIFVAALSIRLFYLFEIKDTPFFAYPRLDALFHDIWARRIAAGDFFGEQAFFRAPLYPYVLALLYKIFGESYVVPRVFQHVLGAFVVVFVYLITRRVFGKQPAAIASLLACLYAVLIYFEGELLYDSFLTALATAWALLYLRAVTRPSLLNWSASGLLYGLICITRPTFLILILPMLAYAVAVFPRTLTRGKKYLLVASFAFFMSLAIIPITIRNYVLSGDIVLIASQGGINFYIGNNEYADGFSSSIPGFQGASWENTEQAAYIEKALGYTPGPAEESWFWYKKGIEFIFNHPLDALALLLKKAYLFWNWAEIPNNQSFYSFSQYSATLRVLPVGFWLVGSLGLFGMFLSRRYRTARLLSLFVISFWLVTIAFFVCDRFRLPVVPLLCAFSGYAVFVLYRQVREGDWTRRIKGIALLALSGLVVNSNLYEVTLVQPEQDLLRLAMQAVERGDYTAGIRYAEEASSSQPNMPNLHLTKGVAEWMQGNVHAAKGEFFKELENNPQSYIALVNLSQLYAEQRIADSAVFFGRRAVEIRPQIPVGYTSTAIGLQLRGDVQRAESLLHIGLQKCGRDFQYGEYLLANIEFSKGQTENAAARYRRVLRGLETAPQPAYELEFGFSDEVRMGARKSVLRSEAANGLGHVFATRNQIDSAAAWFQVASQADSLNADAWSNLGLALMQLREYTGAEQSLRRAVSIDTDNHLYWFNLGIFFGNVGRLSEAETAFEKALRIRPEFEPANEKLSLTLKLMKK